MKAVVMHRSGSPEVLQFEDVLDPSPSSNEVLIKNQAAGINFSDTGRRRNAMASELPLILGTEAAGRIVAVGPDVSGFEVGDYVACQGISGGYAEKVLCRVSDASSTGGSRDQGGRLVHVPEGMKPEEAVAAMLQALTAHAMAFGAYQIKPGDRVLIQAGAGGVGLMLTQMAKNAGAYVYATVGSDAKARFAVEAGADEVINYSLEDFETYVLHSTGGKGVNAIFDAVGGPTFIKGMRCLVPLGTMVSFGSAGGPIEPLGLNQLGSGKYVISTRMSNHTPTRAAWLARASEILTQIKDGKLRTFVTTFPLSEAGNVHRALESRESVGKLALVP